MITKIFDYLEDKIRKLSKSDDYDWETYTGVYGKQLLDMEDNFDFIVNKFVKTSYTIVFYDRIHENWKELYRAVLRCKPKTVFECGCGGMYHLKNIKYMFPNVAVYGCDLLSSQIDYGRKKFEVDNGILHNVVVMDFAVNEMEIRLGKYDFVYSHAVMMHLSRRKALKFLKNMIKISKKYIFILEGSRHNYLELLTKLGELKNFKVKIFQRHGYKALLLRRK